MSSSGKQPRTMSATHRAVEEIRQLIFNGELTADSNHLESELANRLGISRTPVREATLMLQARGLLEVQPRKGVRISAISVEDMRKIYLVITEMECLAARLAAEFNYKKSDLAELNGYIDEMDAALAENDLEAWAEADEAFHMELVKLGQNERIDSVVVDFNDQVRRARSITLHMRPIPVQSNADHRAVSEAILAGDAALADKLHRAHRENSRKLLIDILEQSGLKRV